MLYFAYGSNLNMRHMAWRCPKAVAIGKFSLHDARLVFRGVADCIFEEGSTCPGAIWRITPECEDRLDSYEGIASGMYRKEYVDLEGAPAGDDRMLYYAMNSTGIYPPAQHYLDVIKQGYRDFKMPMGPLLDAVRASHDKKAPTFRERQRARRSGRPALAARPIE